MAFQVIAGLPWLAGVFTTFVTTIVLALSRLFTLRLAIVALAFTAITALTVGLFTALEAAIQSVTFAAPEFLSVAVSWAVPSNFTACVSAIATAHVARFIYEWNVRFIRMKVGS